MTTPWPVHDIGNELRGVEDEPPGDVLISASEARIVAEIAKLLNPRADTIISVWHKGWQGLAVPILWPMQTERIGWSEDAMLAD